MTKLTTNRNYKAVAGALFAFLVCAGSFVPTPVYADFGTAELWSLVNAGLVSSPAVTSLKNSVVEQYTSLSPGELTMLEYELGAIYTVGSVVLSQEWFAEHGVQFDSFDGSYTITGLTSYINENNLRTFVTASCLSSKSGLIFNCEVGNFGVVPIVLNGNVFQPRFAIGGTSPRNSLQVYNQFSNSNGATLALYSGGWFDMRNGVPNIEYNNSSSFGVAGYTGLPYGYVVDIYNPFTWVESGNNYWFYQPSAPAYIMCYCSSMPLDSSIETPEDLYNFAYNKALTDYPEYIENWVDLEDDFNAVEPSVFDSLEFPPYIPNVDFHDVEVPSETLPTGLTDGAGFWFSAFTNMVEAFNLKPYVILFLCIMLVMVILKV